MKEGKGRNVGREEGLQERYREVGKSRDAKGKEQDGNGKGMERKR